MIENKKIDLKILKDFMSHRESILFLDNYAYELNNRILELKNKYENCLNEIRHLKKLYESSIEIENIINKKIKIIEDRLKRAEELLKFCDYDERINDLEEMSIESRLLNLESKFISPLIAPMRKVTREEFLKEYPDIKLNTENEREIPHKCPVCSRMGKNHVWDTINNEKNYMGFLECNSCEGKGIVWR